MTTSQQQGKVGHRVLVVGCGSIGGRHARILDSLGASLGLVDPDRTRCREIGVEVPEEAMFGSLAEALESDWDAAWVCSPTSLHVSQTRQILGASISAMVEKPLSLTAQSAEPLLALAAERGLVLAVGHNWRCHPGVLRTRELLAEGAVGRPCVVNIVQGSYLPSWHPERDYRVEYSARPELGGGVLLDASHEIDYALWLFGNPTEATMVKGTVGDLGIETEDSAFVSFRTDQNVMVNISLDYLSHRPVRRMRVAGTRGGLETDLLAGTLTCFRDGVTEESTFDADVSGTYREQARRFLSALSGDGEPGCSGREGVRVLRLLSSTGGA